MAEAIPKHILDGAAENLRAARELEEARAASGNPYVPPGPGLFPERDDWALRLAQRQLRYDLGDYYKWSADQTDPGKGRDPTHSETEAQPAGEFGQAYNNGMDLSQRNLGLALEAGGLEAKGYGESLESGERLQPPADWAKDERGNLMPKLSLDDIKAIAAGTYKPAQNFSDMERMMQLSEEGLGGGAADPDPNEE